MMNIKEGLLTAEHRGPFLFQSNREGVPLHAFVAQNLALIARTLKQHGSILFRGFGVTQPDAFAEFITACAIGRLDYQYRSTPRTALGRGLYTATEYPASREIPLHNENAYQRVWPKKLAFCCLRPAASGGATPIADVLEMQRQLDPAIFERFKRLGVRYDRVIHGHIDLSWQEVFQTQDKSVVGQYCDENDIRYEWLEDDVLKTSQICQGVVRHEEHGEDFFFNQAHLFHPSALGEQTLGNLLDAFGPELLPRNAFYGDGSAIEGATLAAVRAAYATAAVDLNWEAGDVALLDNIQVAHGRRSYTGDRQILAALLEPNRVSPPSVVEKSFPCPSRATS